MEMMIVSVFCVTLQTSFLFHPSFYQLLLFHSIHSFIFLYLRLHNTYTLFLPSALSFITASSSSHHLISVLHLLLHSFVHCLACTSIFFHVSLSLSFSYKQSGEWNEMKISSLFFLPLITTTTTLSMHFHISHTESWHAEIERGRKGCWELFLRAKCRLFLSSSFRHWWAVTTTNVVTPKWRRPLSQTQLSFSLPC